MSELSQPMPELPWLIAQSYYLFIECIERCTKTYHISSIIHRSLINAWCKPTVYEINAGGVAQYPHNNNRTCYGDKEKSVHCNNLASGRRVGRKDVKGGSCNVGEELPVNCEYGNEHSVLRRDIIRHGGGRAATA